MKCPMAGLIKACSINKQQQQQKQQKARGKGKAVYFGPKICLVARPDQQFHGKRHYALHISQKLKQGEEAATCVLVAVA